MRRKSVEGIEGFRDRGIEGPDPQTKNHFRVESFELDTNDPQCAKQGAKLLAQIAARVFANARARGVQIACVALLGGSLTLPSVGCTITAMPAEATSAFKAVAVSAMDQAVWDKVLANIAARVNNPGMRVSFGTEYYVETKIIGTNGEVEVRADGAGNGQGASPEARQALIRTLTREYGLTPQEAIAAVLEAERQINRPLAERLVGPTQQTGSKPVPQPQAMTPAE